MLVICEKKSLKEAEKYANKNYHNKKVFFFSDLSYTLAGLYRLWKETSLTSKSMVFFVEDYFTFKKKLFIALVSFFSLFSRRKNIIVNFSETTEIGFTFYIKTCTFLFLYIFLNFIILIGIFPIILLFSILLRRPPKTNKNAKSKKVACIYPQLFVGRVQGGHTAHIRGTVKGFSDNGYSPTVFCQTRIPGMKAEFHLVSNPFEEYLQYQFTDIFFNFYMALKMISVIKKEQYAFIYQRHSAFNLTGSIVSLFTRIPLILEVNAVIEWEKSSFKKKSKMDFLIPVFEKIAFSSAHKIMTIAKKLAEEFKDLSYNPDKVFVNPNGVDPEIFYPGIPNNSLRENLRLENFLVVGFSGNFSIWHGVDTLTYVAREVINKRKNVIFLFMGDGLEKCRLEESLKDEISEGRVIFTGMVPMLEVPKYLDLCHILLSPIGKVKENSSPIKIFEYMAMGKAIVCYDIGQMNDVLENGKTALLIADGMKDDFLNAVLMLIDDESLRNRISENALIKSSEHSWKKNARIIIEQYEKI